MNVGDTVVIDGHRMTVQSVSGDFFWAEGNGVRMKSVGCVPQFKNDTSFVHIPKSKLKNGRRNKPKALPEGSSSN